MQSLTRLTIFLCCLWIVTLLYGEMVAYWIPNWTCSWPHLRPSSPSSVPPSKLRRFYYIQCASSRWGTCSLFQAIPFYPSMVPSTSIESCHVIPLRIQLESEKSNGHNFVKVAVLADPQLVDWTSYGLPPKSLALEAAQFYTDLYMRRSFHLSILPFRPDFVIFLGDLFDGGSSLSDEEWKESLNRFEHIFTLSEKDGFQIPIYYVPGNRDIGFASFHSQYPKVIRRYEDQFGERNYQFSVGNVDFIVVDAQILDGSMIIIIDHKPQVYEASVEEKIEETRALVESLERVLLIFDSMASNHMTELGKETSFSWDFVRNISNDATVNPKVLLTHIPLHHPNETLCGPHRSSPVINQKISVTGTDFGKSLEFEEYPLFAESMFFIYKLIYNNSRYQNYLSEETSSRLLDLIRPILVLSGHDHDQCTMIHSTPVGTVKEHTVGTVSWLQGNLYPSFMLLSVVSSSSNSINSEDAVSTQLCFLPKQAHIYFWYLMQFIATLILIITWPANGFGLSDKFMSYIREIKTNLSTTTKEKDEENSEYEMIWDAEGSMHLVKKAAAKVPIQRSDSRFTGSGTVISRPSAKKQSMEAEASVSVDMSAELNLEDASKSRLGKSKLRIIIQRLFRLRLLVVVAAVSGPVYMMLLFKDWIDR
ncbi:hypothetical protein ZIOFF_062136 [Zingiber officinale]|uniref:Calcineurin-like phosphoesterase domain-containing protein n=1 Tax=Zingiber officinale TaxID=94328 RepID=A0A8J5KE85_ZINOF|nr:hypothetical protein ZIOFF_062136 [Zingiber officinale]